MSTPPPFSSPFPDWFAVSGNQAEEAAFGACCELCAAAHRLLATSRVFAESGRAVDLSGLPLWIGRIVASALDLDPGFGRRMQPHLRELLVDLDRLQLALEAEAA